LKGSARAKDRLSQGLVNTPRFLVSCRFQKSKVHVFMSIDMVCRLNKTLFYFLTLCINHTCKHVHSHTNKHKMYKQITHIHSTKCLSNTPPTWLVHTYLLAVLIWTAAANDPEAEATRLATANPKAFEGVKKSYEISKRTYTRTDYEVDFGVVYNKLCNLGAKFDSNAYLSKVPVRSLI